MSRYTLRPSAFLPFLMVATLGLTGCYTQLATYEAVHGGLTRVEADYEDDGDVVVRKFYDDGTVDQDYVTAGYDWYLHEPFTYRRYFSSFYDPFYGVGYYGGCGYFDYCDPFYGSHFSLSLGFGYGYAGWGYSRFSPWGYSPWGYSVWGYSPWGYSSFPSYAYYPPYYGGGGVNVRGARGSYGPRGATMTRDALASGGRSDVRGGRGNTTTLTGTRSTLSGMSDRNVVSVGSGGATLGKDTDRRTTRSVLSNGRTTESTRARSYGRTTTTRTRATTESGSTRTRTYDSGRSTRTRSYGTSGSTRSRSSDANARSTRSRSSDSGRAASPPPRVRTDSGASRSSGAVRSSGSSGGSRSSGATRSSSGGSRSSSSGTSSKRSGRNNN